MKYLTLSLLLALPTPNALATNLLPSDVDQQQIPVLNNDIRTVDNNVQSLHSYTQSQSGNTQSIVGAPATPTAYPGLYGSSYKPVGLPYAITYNSVSGATYYELYESTTDSNYSQVQSGSQLSASFTHYDYGYRYYKYKACNSAGCSSLSPWRRVYVYTAPSNPNNLSVSPLDVSAGTSYNVSWTPSGGAVDGTVYSVYQSLNGGSESLVATRTRQHWSETSYSFVTSQSTAGNYNYRVQACSPSAGCSGSVSAIQTVTPAANTAPTAISQTITVNKCKTTQFPWGQFAVDAEGGPLKIEILEKDARLFAFVIEDTLWTMPFFGKCLFGNHKFTFRAVDSEGLKSSIATVTLNLQ